MWETAKAKKDRSCLIQEAVTLLEELRISIENDSASSKEIRKSASNLTYSEAAKKKVTSPIITSQSHILVVSSKINISDSDNIKKEFKSKINPVSLRLGIKNIKNMRDGKILVETMERRDIEKIEEVLKSDETLKVGIPKKLNPKIIIKRLPEEVSKDNLICTLIAQNSELCITEERIKFLTIFGGKSSTSPRHALLEIDPNLRDTLLSNRLKLFHTICVAEDYLSVRQCRKCNKYNHPEKHCKSKLTCAICCGEHYTQDCPKKEEEEERKCINCINYNKHCSSNFRVNSNHLATSKCCPSYINAIHRLIRNTNYSSSTKLQLPQWQ